MTLDIPFLLVAGLALLVAGGEFLVRGSARLAELAGISPLVIGLTVVAYGTSMPELAVSLRASLTGNPDIAVGNVVGSNIFNILFILGACAVLSPLVVNRRLVRVDVPVMIGVSVLAAALASNGRLARLECALLFLGAVLYTAWSVIHSRAETAATQNAAEDGKVPGGETIEGKHPSWLAAMPLLGTVGALGATRAWWGWGEGGAAAAGALLFLAGHTFGRGGTTRGGDLLHQSGFIVSGLGLLVLGAGWLVRGSVGLAQAFGVSDAVIGLTIVAAGTSLPEVATSLVATVRGQRDLAIGNVVGSNIANLLVILGLTGIATPNGLPVTDSIRAVDLPVMIAVAAVCLPVFYTCYLIRRWEGAIFLIAYLAYATWLVFDATGNNAATALGNALGWVFTPIVLATFAVTGLRALTTRRHHPPPTP